MIGVGILVTGHGVRGLGRVKPYNPTSSILSDCPTVWLKRTSDGQPTRFEVTQSRPHKRFFLVGLQGIDSLDALEPWFKSEVCVEASFLPDAKEGEFYHFEAIGLAVRTVDGQTVGRVRDVLALPGHDTWVVDAAGSDGPRELLIPLVGEIVKEVDLTGGIAIIDPPAGLLEE